MPGLRGPLIRSIAERLPAALAWGAGIGIYGLMIAAASRSFAEEQAKTPELLVTLQFVGTLALGLYATVLAGVDLAVGGLVSTAVAGPAVAVVAVVTFLIDFLVPALDLPDWLRQFALSADLGQPMVGTWEWTGVVASLALAVGGLALGAWGMRRRDVSR